MTSYEHSVLSVGGGGVSRNIRHLAYGIFEISSLYDIADYWLRFPRLFAGSN